MRTILIGLLIAVVLLIFAIGCGEKKAEDQTKPPEEVKEAEAMDTTSMDSAAHGMDTMMMDSAAEAMKDSM